MALDGRKTLKRVGDFDIDSLCRKSARISIPDIDVMSQSLESSGHTNTIGEPQKHVSKHQVAAQVSQGG